MEKKTRTRLVRALTALLTLAFPALACSPLSYETRTLDDGSKVTWIADNAKPHFMPAKLFPAATDSMIQACAGEQGFPASVSVFLLEKDGKKILFDAGAGAPDSRLQKTLAALHIAPDEIDAVLMTHLHGDHIGGLLSGTEAAFPKALLLIAQDELAWWKTLPAERTPVLDKVLKAYEGQLSTFTPGEELLCEIRPIYAAGHTPGHTVFCVSNLLVLGDIVHALDLQLPNPRVSATFDQDKDAAADRRVWLLEHARREGLLVAGMHFPAPAFLTW